ncbi:hypothetical protein JVU11DRAFT_11250 [Chiua virens]|nr:hypothetical protein JVU11DRAFT_11250 [Chiua virens]
MTAQTTLTVSYALSPPEGTKSPPSLTSNGVHTFAVAAEKTGNVREYYHGVSKSLAAAKEKVGKELTAWRDAVGNAEVGKEKTAKAARSEDEDEEDEEEN